MFKRINDEVIHDSKPSNLTRMSPLKKLPAKDPEIVSVKRPPRSKSLRGENESANNGTAEDVGPQITYVRPSKKQNITQNVAHPVDRSKETHEDIEEEDVV